MFIEIKEHLIPVKDISYIKRIGSGVRVQMPTYYIDIIDVSDAEYEEIKRKLCGDFEVYINTRVVSDEEVKRYLNEKYGAISKEVK